MNDESKPKFCKLFPKQIGKIIYNNINDQSRTSGCPISVIYKLNNKNNISKGA